MSAAAAHRLLRGRRLPGHEPKRPPRSVQGQAMPIAMDHLTFGGYSHRRQLKEEAREHHLCHLPVPLLR
jgi:hypothetical protein